MDDDMGEMFGESEDEEDAPQLVMPDGSLG